ncbi:septum formation inhibitor Maf [Schaalia sp. ZJ405]|uniref:Maf family protein n=1 Tax=unclassified Schaalia TaxID=2691889 RepID=UPI0013EBF455|nr:MULTISPECIES: nucleoside triphosphate pyrophosphatase [unclassified Schaalia]QPK81682.1 septum formation inhibitor Maf [Schaalia sp. ZJ405]
MRLILASKSPARRATLISAGITPIIRVSHVDEDAVLARAIDAAQKSTPDSHDHTRQTHPRLSPAQQVTLLAQAKCEAVVNDICTPTSRDDSTPDELPAGKLLVVGCDSMLEMNGEMLGKPHTPEVARARIRAMSGKSGTLWTGHYAALLGSRDGSLHQLVGTSVRASHTVVNFTDMSDEEIDAYVDSGEPLAVAGSFTIDGLGGPFIRGVEGDHHAVVGISLPLLREMATELGIFWPDLWDHRRTN